MLIKGYVIKKNIGTLNDKGPISLTLSCVSDSMIFIISANVIRNTSFTYMDNLPLPCFFTKCFYVPLWFVAIISCLMSGVSCSSILASDVNR